LEIPEIKIKSRSNKTAVEPISKPPEATPVKESRHPTSQSVLNESNHLYEATQKISIKDALNAAERRVSSADEEEREIVDFDQPEIKAETIESKPLSAEFLEICLNSYAEQIRDDKPRMAVTIKSVKPKITDDFSIAIELNNRSQLDDFNNNTRNDLEKFLRHEMQNSRISVQAELIETQDSSVVKLYTPEERFKYLSLKNPDLATFKNKLNLELE
jgi:hypothetical protein